MYICTRTYHDRKDNADLFHDFEYAEEKEEDDLEHGIGVDSDVGNLTEVGVVRLVFVWYERQCQPLHKLRVRTVQSYVYMYVCTHNSNSYTYIHVYNSNSYTYIHVYNSNSYTYIHVYNSNSYTYIHVYNSNSYTYIHVYNSNSYTYIHVKSCV